MGTKIKFLLGKVNAPLSNECLIEDMYELGLLNGKVREIKEKLKKHGRPNRN